VHKNDIALALDAVKKVTDFFSSNIKMFINANGQARVDIVTRKFVEVIVIRPSL
jgi:hypothetical protein